MAGNPIQQFTDWIDRRIQTGIQAAITTLTDNQAKVADLLGPIVKDAVSGAVTPLAAAVEQFPGNVLQAIAGFPEQISQQLAGPIQGLKAAAEQMTNLPQTIESAISQAFSNIHLPIPNIFGEHQQVVVRHRQTGQEHIIREPEDLK